VGSSSLPLEGGAAAGSGRYARQTELAFRNYDVQPVKSTPSLHHFIWDLVSIGYLKDTTEALMMKAVYLIPNESRHAPGFTGIEDS